MFKDCRVGAEKDLAKLVVVRELTYFFFLSSKEMDFRPEMQEELMPMFPVFERWISAFETPTWDRYMLSDDILEAGWDGVSEIAEKYGITGDLSIYGDIYYGDLFRAADADERDFLQGFENYIEQLEMMSRQ